MERTATLRDEIAAGAAAGIAGGIASHAFLLAVAVAGGAPLGTAASELYRFIASAAVGRDGATQPSALPLGVALHFAVAIGWALGYVYLARTQPQVLTRPVVSGLAFGAVVFVFMNVVLIAAGLYGRPTAASAAVGIVEHLVFYGLPVALVASRLLRRA